MAVKPGIRITDAGKVIERVNARMRASGKSANVDVGFRAPYAVYVHENLQMYHTNGQAKFLERPTREYAQEIREIVNKNLRNKEALATALRRAGNFLLEKAKELVPVNTGYLRDSGFVRVY